MRRRVCLVCSGVLLVPPTVARRAPTCARAQKPPDEPPKPNQEQPRGQPDCPHDSRGRSTSMPGWGTFGFGNSLYRNPREPGVTEEPERPVVRGIRQTVALGRVHVRIVEPALRQRSAPSASAPMDPHRRRSASTRHRSAPRISRSAGGPASRCRLARTRLTSRSAARRTSLGTGSCFTTAPPKAEVAAATGPTRVRPSSSPRSAASSQAPTRSRRSIWIRDDLPENDADTDSRA